ncbi:hypothetical protein MRX96_001781 [Rhipicephalus microplus]
MVLKLRGVGVVMLWVLLIWSCRAQLKAGCKPETLRACGDDYVAYAKKPLLHSSGEELKESCENDKRELVCGTNFVKDCMEGVTKAVLLPVAEGFKKKMEGACNSTSKEHEELRHDDCFLFCRRNNSFYDMFSCVNHLLTQSQSCAKELAFDSLFGMFLASQSRVCGVYTMGSPACKSLLKLPDLLANDRNIENYIKLLAETAVALGRTNLTSQRTK